MRTPSPTSRRRFRFTQTFVAAHNALGCAYFNRKEIELARQEFSRAIALDDHLSSSYVNLGRLQLSLREVSAAQSSLEKASSIAPLDDNLLTSLAYVQFLNHDYPAAVRTAQRAHARNHPGSALVHYFAAAACQAQNNLDQTQSELHTFLVEDSNSTFAQIARQTLANIASEGMATTSVSDTTSVSFDAAQNSTRSLRGEKALQDFRKKQQIAEAEAANADCATCYVPDAHPTAESAASSRSAAAPRSNSAFAFHSTAEEVAVFFTATDHGKSVTDLSQQDIVLQDDQKPPAADDVKRLPGSHLGN